MLLHGAFHPDSNSVLHLESRWYPGVMPAFAAVAEAGSGQREVGATRSAEVRGAVLNFERVLSRSPEQTYAESFS